jgi:hypothetical protein
MDTEIPSDYELGQNYPNPFNPTTTISFALPAVSEVRLNIYTITGELISTVIDDRLPAGNHTFEVDADMLTSGVYIYTLSANQFVSSKKMILMK